MNYRSLIEKLISGLDIGSKSGRKKAYSKCIDYAEENFKEPRDYNSFVAQAAKMLDEVPCIQDVAAVSTPSTGNEKLHLAYSQQSGPVLTGNKSGLLYLSNLLKNLAASQEENDHAHLYHDEFPMYGRTFPLTIYLENDPWFLKHANESPEAEQAPEVERPYRQLDPNSIAAFAVLDEIPPTMPIIKGNLYKVQSCTKYKDEDVWIKAISEESERLFLFTFNNDENVLSQIALDIDDPKIFFLTKYDVEKLK